ncbi:TPA: hypothetical protein I9Z65_000546 [Clostridium perfringens]|nr:hypothetical protein [Clostridium perfringens]HBC2032360.1 hypothetical protein [Clostridium perfringens]HBC2056095.1 hypothetical protein [Clostridium perfringens]HBC2070215.1 hypothetical protein [Clostridium perfringens]
MMNILAWIVLIMGSVISLVTFKGIFTGKTITDRVSQFITFVLWILICILSIYVIRL